MYNWSPREKERENGVEKYFKKQCLKTSQFDEKCELADIYTNTVKYKENHSQTYYRPAAENQR